MKRVLASLSMAMLLMAAGPAIAHHKTAHEKGPAHEQGPQGTTVNAQEGGNSPSVPDSDGTGADHGEPGPDKQHDGNNGCGNEPRSEGHPGEDDNNGKCGPGGKVHPSPSPTHSPSPTPSAHPTPVPSPTPSATVRPTPEPTASPTPTAKPTVRPTPEVRNPSPTPPHSGERLPSTGSGLMLLAFGAVGLVFIGGGYLLWKRPS
jgi:LPXTG-motif cell wall-anchored protein